MRSRYCTVEANYRYTQSRGLSATAEAELLVLIVPEIRDKELCFCTISFVCLDHRPLKFTGL